MGILVDVVNMAFQVMIYMILIRVLLSYFPHNPYNRVIRFLYETTELVLGPVRRIMPEKLTMPIDFTPVVALLGLQMVVYPIVMSILVRL